MTMTHSHHPQARRRLDVASLLLLACGLSFGFLACWLVHLHSMNVVVIVPSIVAIATGAMHLTKWEAPRT